MAEENKNRTLECSICMRDYWKPKRLACYHSYCLNCLIKYCKDSKTAELIVCPQCSKETKISKAGVENLPGDVMLERMVFEDRVTRFKENLISCEVCTKSASKASSYCEECIQYMCFDCMGKHSRLNATASHSTVSMIFRPRRLQIEKEKNRVGRCDKHMTERTIVHCRTCDLKICEVCSREEHRGHDMSAIENPVEEQRKRLGEEIKTAEQMRDSVTQRVALLSKQKEKVLVESSKVEQRIKNRCKTIRKKVDEYESAILNQLSDIMYDVLEELEKGKNQYDEPMKQINNFINHVTEIQENGEGDEVLQAVNDAHSRAQGLTVPLEEIEEHSALNRSEEAIQNSFWMKICDDAIDFKQFESLIGTSEESLTDTRGSWKPNPENQIKVTKPQKRKENSEINGNPTKPISVITKRRISREFEAEEDLNLTEKGLVGFETEENGRLDRGSDHQHSNKEIQKRYRKSEAKQSNMGMEREAAEQTRDYVRRDEKRDNIKSDLSGDEMKRDLSRDLRDDTRREMNLDRNDTRDVMRKETRERRDMERDERRHKIVRDLRDEMSRNVNERRRDSVRVETKDERRRDRDEERKDKMLRNERGDYVRRGEIRRDERRDLRRDLNEERRDLRRDLNEQRKDLNEERRNLNEQRRDDNRRRYMNGEKGDEEYDSLERRRNPDLHHSVNNQTKNTSKSNNRNKSTPRIQAV